jgi:hypothetical protein
MTSITNSSYGLFYSKEKNSVLVCKTYYGLKIGGKEEIIYCRRNKYSRDLKSPYEIQAQIEKTKKKLMDEGGYAVVFPHKLSKSSINFIAPGINTFYNLIGGGIEEREGKREDKEQALRREIGEELFLNLDPSEREAVLDDIMRKIDYHPIPSEDKLIFFINYDILHESTKRHIRRGIEDSSMFKKTGKSCGVDVELGEIDKLIWLTLNDAKREFKRSLVKFNEENLLVDEINKIYEIEKDRTGYEAVVGYNSSTYGRGSDRYEDRGSDRYSDRDGGRGSDRYEDRDRDRDKSRGWDGKGREDSLYNRRVGVHEDRTGYGAVVGYNSSTYGRVWDGKGREDSLYNRRVGVHEDIQESKEEKDYRSKYLKYKKKYLTLKKEINL